MPGIERAGQRSTEPIVYVGQTWRSTGSKIILYDYAPTRSQQVPIDLLDDYSGYLQTDGYDGYGFE